MERTPNERLRAAIKRAGWSYDALARAVRAVAAEAGEPLRTNRSAVAHWVAGRVEPTPRTVGYLTEAFCRRLRVPLSPAELGLPAPPEPSDLGLDLTVEPVEALTSLGRADMERRTVITGAAYSVAATALPMTLLSESASRARAASSGRIAGAADVEAVHDMIALFTNVDERWGGAHGRSALVQYVTHDVLPLCRARFRTTGQHRDMLLAAASLTCLLGWKAFDSGEHGLAQRYYLQALRLTTEADSDVHTAFALRSIVQHAVLLGRPENTVAMAEHALALASGKVDPGTESLFVMARARALGREGRKQLAVAEAARAGRMAGGADDTERVPHWSALWAPSVSSVATSTAQLLDEIGDLTAAERSHAQANKGFIKEQATGASKGFRRYYGISILYQGEIQWRQGRAEEACHTWNEGLSHLDGVHSARTVETVRRIRSALARFQQRNIPGAARTDERARAWLAAAA